MMSRSRTRWACAGGVVATLGLRASVSHADVGALGAPDDWWTQWSWDPVVLGALVLAGWMHVVGTRRLWRSAGRGRGVSVGSVAAFHVGLLCLALALVSPLDALGATLFSAHMIQHLLLVAVAAPLVVLGRPLVVFAWSIPSEVRGVARRVICSPMVRGARAILGRPIVALALHAVALWAWHMPALYEAALEDDFVHWLEHGSFFGTSVLLWGALLGRCGSGARIVYLFVSATQGAVLGALLTVAPTPWYTTHAAGAQAWGVDLLTDQRIAGLIMWIPGGVVHLVAALFSFRTWLVMSERAVRRKERLRGGTWRRGAEVASREPSRERRASDVANSDEMVGARSVLRGM
jgi:putative membrane protein